MKEWQKFYIYENVTDSECLIGSIKLNLSSVEIENDASNFCHMSKCQFKKSLKSYIFDTFNQNM